MIFYSLTFALFFAALIMLTHLVKGCKSSILFFVSQYCFLRLLGCAFPTLVGSRYSDLLLWCESV